MPKNGIKILKVDHHRNGMKGNPFYVITFKNHGLNMVGIVFDELIESPFDKKIAVLDIDLLSEGIIEFSKNSFCGDEFEKELKQAIRVFEDNRIYNL